MCISSTVLQHCFTVCNQDIDNDQFSGHPNTWVGGLWSIDDTPVGGSTNTLDNGFAIWTDENGEWRQDFFITFTGEPVNHLVEFSFVDFGDGSGSHNWHGSATGDIVVDPYPPVVPEPISSTLFIIGGATLGFRQFRKRRLS